MRHLFIFDKDNTLTTTVSGETFVQHPQDQKLQNHVLSKLKELQLNGVEMAIASNQGGIKEGHKSELDAIDEMRYCMSLCKGLIRVAAFASEDNVATFVEGSEVHRNSGIPETLIHQYRAQPYYRKPGPGMLLDLMVMKGYHPASTTFVGDRLSDLQAAEHAQVRFINANRWRDPNYQSW